MKKPPTAALKTLENIEKTQKLILDQQRQISKKQEDINKLANTVNDESILIWQAIQEMRSGKILFISRELEEQIKRASRLALAIDRKVED